MEPSNSEQRVTGMLEEIISCVRSLQEEQTRLSIAISTMNGRVNTLAGIKSLQDAASTSNPAQSPRIKTLYEQSQDQDKAKSSESIPSLEKPQTGSSTPSESTPRHGSTTSKIILTSYPGQAGVDPITMNWGHISPAQRGPVVVARTTSTIRRRNGTHAISPEASFLH